MAGSLVLKDVNWPTSSTFLRRARRQKVRIGTRSSPIIPQTKPYPSRVSSPPTHACATMHNTRLATYGRYGANGQRGQILRPCKAAACAGPISQRAGMSLPPAQDCARAEEAVAAIAAMLCPFGPRALLLEPFCGCENMGGWGVWGVRLAGHAQHTTHTLSAYVAVSTSLPPLSEIRIVTLGDSPPYSANFSVLAMRVLSYNELPMLHQ